MYKLFFKIYEGDPDDMLVFKGIIALDPPITDIDIVDFVDGLSDVIGEGFSFKPTTLNAFIKFKEAQSIGNIAGIEDLEKDNIMC